MFSKGLAERIKASVTKRTKRWLNANNNENVALLDVCNTAKQKDLETGTIAYCSSSLGRCRIVNFPLDYNSVVGPDRPTSAGRVTGCALRVACSSSVRRYPVPELASLRGEALSIQSCMIPVHTKSLPLSKTSKLSWVGLMYVDICHESVEKGKG